MRKTKTVWFVLLTFACVLSGAAIARSAEPNQNAEAEQPAESNVGTTNKASVQAESSTSASDEMETGDAEWYRKGRVHHDAIVKLGRDAELKAGDSADAVVVIGANAKIDGRVRQAVVVIFGDLEINGEVGDA